MKSLIVKSDGEGEGNGEGKPEGVLWSVVHSSRGNWGQDDIKGRVMTTDGGPGRGDGLEIDEILEKAPEPALGGADTNR